MKLKPRTALATDPAAGSAPEMKFAAAVGAAMEDDDPDLCDECANAESSK